MSSEKKQARITELQAEKEIFLEKSRIAYKQRVAAYNDYLLVNREWSILKSKYEALDREEKLLDFSLKNHPAAKTKLLKKKKSGGSKKTNETKAKTALAALSPEQLAKLLKDYKS
jgi:hypothetical protein